MFINLKRHFEKAIKVTAAYLRTIFRRKTHEQIQDAQASESPTPPQPVEQVLATPTAAPREADVLAAGLVPPATEPQPADAAPNRATRRAHSAQRRHYERQRRKFDQFVTPQGELPEPKHRGENKTPTPERRPSPQVTIVEDTNDAACVDVHHTDRLTEVLYEQREFLGEFSFRDTILEQLERYFVYLDRMKRHDPQSYGYYREVGATLIPYAATPDIWRDFPRSKEKRDGEFKKLPMLTPWFLATRPTFGCIAYGTSPEVEKIENVGERHNGTLMKCWIPKFMYFSKYESPPPELQPMSGGDVYKMTVWWDKAQERKYKHGRPNDFGVFVSRDGCDIKVLRMIETRRVPIYSKRHGMAAFSRRDWRIPNDYEDWAREHGVDVQRFLSSLFCNIARKVETAAYSMVRVSVEKGGRHALFSLDVGRAPYFFRDRDIELTESGVRKPVFHAVRAHTRDTGVTRMHFRGQRQFTWAGYNVRITIPGKHHGMTEEIDFGVHDSYWIDPKERRDDYVSAEIMGKTIRADLDEKPASVIRKMIEDEGRGSL